MQFKVQRVFSPPSSSLSSAGVSSGVPPEVQASVTLNRKLATGDSVSVQVDGRVLLPPPRASAGATTATTAESAAGAATAAGGGGSAAAGDDAAARPTLRRARQRCPLRGHLLRSGLGARVRSFRVIFARRTARRGARCRRLL